MTILARTGLSIALAMLLLPDISRAGDARVMVTEVKDNRTTGQSFNSLDIRLKLTGDDVAGAKGIRTLISKAVDETGRNLLKDEEKGSEFKPLRDGDLGPEIELRFRNPARRAAVVRELSGEVQLFMPDRDPAATVVLANFIHAAGKPVQNRALTQAGVTMTVLTKKEYDVLLKQKEQQAAQGAGKDLGQAMLQAFKGMFSGFFQVGENDLILKIADPSGKFISTEVLNGRGTVIATTSTTYADDLRVLGFDQPLPVDAQLRVFLKSSRSVMTIPFKLADIALP